MLNWLRSPNGACWKHHGRWWNLEYNKTGWMAEWTRLYPIELNAMLKLNYEALLGWCDKINIDFILKFISNPRRSSQWMSDFDRQWKTDILWASYRVCHLWRRLEIRRGNNLKSTNFSQKNAWKSWIVNVFLRWNFEKRKLSPKRLPAIMI